MPGMRLTLAQAARLFNLDLVDCARMLETLVSDGVLRTNGREFSASNVGRQGA
jgi:DNA-binding IclR family transcriptional regulator